MKLFKHKLTLMLCTALSLSAIPFGAANAGGGLLLFPVGEAVENPWYLGTSIGSSKLEPRVIIPGGSVTDNSSKGFQVYGGYKMNQRFALEAFYADLGKAKVDVVTQSSDVDYQAFGIGLVASQPLTKKLNVFAKLGYAKLENSVSSNLAYRQVHQNTVYTGLGMEYKLNQKVSIRLGYDYYDKDYQFLSLGFQINF